VGELVSGAIFVLMIAALFFIRMRWGESGL
jgi:hypothetical protein